MTPEKQQKFRQELMELRKSLGGETAKGSCDAYWACLANCSNLGCSAACCRSFPQCCSGAVNNKVNEIFAKYFSDQP